MAGQAAPLAFIDTCSLLRASWSGVEGPRGEARFDPAKDGLFWESTLPSLCSQAKCVLPAQNLAELQRHAGSTTKPDLASRARFVLARLVPFIESGQVEVMGDPNDPFADAVLLFVAIKFRTTRDLMFVTQDQALARDLIAVSQFESVRPRGGCELKVRRLDGSGRIAKWDELKLLEPKQPKETKVELESDGAKRRWWEVWR